MTQLLSLDQILEEKTCLVLGAGAAADFNQPCWGKLREMLTITFRDANPCTEHDDHWFQTLTNARDDITIDNLAMEARNQEDYNYLQRSICDILLGGEGDDYDTNNWVSVFAKAVAERLVNDREKALTYATNLTVISLNYDRCFNFHFSEGVKKCFSKEYKQNRIAEAHYEVIQKEIENVIHPHGCIGQINELGYIRNYINSSKIDKGLYDIVVEFGGFLDDHYHTPPIFPIDELKLPQYIKNNSAYVEANVALQNAKYCICIGLSPLGITQSLLQFKTEKVFYSGDKEVHSNFIPLGLRAKELVSELVREHP